MRTEERTYNEKILTAHDLMPYFDEALNEVEMLSGIKITWETIVDILNDFGTCPTDMTSEKYAEVVEAIAKDYLSIPNENEPDPYFYDRLRVKYKKYNLPSFA